MSHSIGLYLHIPFCRSKCPYCDFYSVTFGQEEAERYTTGLEAALAGHPFGRRRADSIYFGGGTPALLGPDRIRRLLAAAGKGFAVEAEAEITLEANPADASREQYERFRRVGVNRLSLGVQSLEPGELATLGRRHTPRQARQALEWAAQAGFAHLSGDLMLGLPGQTAEGVRENVRQLAALGIDHLSAYLLKIEENTPFARREMQDLCPGEDEAAELYLACVAAAEEEGLRQYEISNFAKPGGESRHNLKYWRCQEYLGLGPSAHSYLDGRRFGFPRVIEGFPGRLAFEAAEDNGQGGGWEEYAMLRLRLTEGLDTALLEGRYGLTAGGLLRRGKALAPHGLTRVDGGVIRLTPQGFLLSNTVTAHILYG